MKMRAWAGVVLGLLVSAEALAYAPPAGFIMELVARKRMGQKMDAMRVVVMRTEYEGDKAQPPVEVTTTLRMGGRIRREWKDAAGVVHVRVSDPSRLMTVDGDKKGRGTPPPELLDALWTTGSTPEEREAAQARGKAVLDTLVIPDSPIGFSRVEGRVAWVIGAETGATPGPQVWVDKDDFLPLRVVYVEGAQPAAAEGEAPKPGNGPTVDIRYRNWGGAIGGEFWPGRIETWRDGKLLRVEELVKIDVTPKIDERDFKID